MNRFIRELTGGFVVIVVAAAIGVAQNTVRSNPVTLISKVAPVKTASHGDKGDAAPAPGDSAGEAALPEGSIALAEAKRLFDEQNAIIIDARAPSAFEEGHIPGAVNIPYDKLPEYLETLQLEAPMDGTVMLYCWGPSCDFSDQLATEMKMMGYQDVRVFTGGWEHWSEAEYPTEGTKSE